MSKLTGLFSRGPSYYLRVVLPNGHPATERLRSGRVVLSLGACSRRDAINRGLALRAEVLQGRIPTVHRPDESTAKFAPQPVLRLRDVFTKWKADKPRSADTLSSCERALRLYEEFSGDPAIMSVARMQGVDFRAWLMAPERHTTSKTARDRFVWVKSLWRYAARDLEAIPRSPWEGLSMEARTTTRRRPWRHDELERLFSHSIFTARVPPLDTKAGGDTAFWLPILALFTGARLSELAQLHVADVSRTREGIWTLSLTDDGEEQRLKTENARRTIPIHSTVIALGFPKYVELVTAAREKRLWPALPLRDGKPGGFFSQWFSSFRRELGLGVRPDFHCFRHTVRSALVAADVQEATIDSIMGHRATGSTGTRVYTHRTIAELRQAIERIAYPELRLFQPAVKVRQAA